MLKFSDFIKEMAMPQPGAQEPRKRAVQGLEIEPEEEATYHAIVQQNIDDPTTGNVEGIEGQDDLSWHNLNRAVANSQAKKLAQIRQASGL